MSARSASRSSRAPAPLTTAVALEPAADVAREDELLARDDGVVPHATDEDAPRRRIGPDEVAVLAARESVRPRDRAAEPVEHRGEP